MHFSTIKDNFQGSLSVHLQLDRGALVSSKMIVLRIST